MSALQKPAHVIAVAFFFLFVGFGPAQQYLVVLFNEQGEGYAALAALFLLYGSFLITGIFVSKIVSLLGGLKHSMLLGALTYVIFTASVGLGNIPALFFASILIGVGGGLLWMTSSQIISDTSSKDDAGRNLSLRVVALNAGVIVGIFMADLFLQRGSISILYFSLAAISGIGFILLFLVHPAREMVSAVVHRLFIFDRRMLLLFPFLFGFNFLLAEVFTAMNVIVVTLIGMSALPLIVSISRVGDIVGTFSFGVLSDKIAKLLVVMLLIALALLGIAIFTTGTTFYPLLIGWTCMGLTLSAHLPVIFAWLKERLPANEHSSAFGVAYAYNNIAVMIAIVSNMYLSPHESFIPAIVALILAIPCSIFFNMITRHR